LKLGNKTRNINLVNAHYSMSEHNTVEFPFNLCLDLILHLQGQVSWWFFIWISHWRICRLLCGQPVRVVS